MIAIETLPLLTQDSFTNLNLDDFWSPLLESLDRGVVIVSTDQQIIYCNSKAKLLYSPLLEPDETTILPIAIAEGCDHLAQGLPSQSESLVIELTGREGQPIRSRICWLQTDVVANNVPACDSPKLHYSSYSVVQSTHREYILVLVENCDETLHEALRLEQKRYKLTNREAEIWRLLRQEYSYQKITEVLHISMNTVKTHVRNIHTKRRIKAREQSTFWYSR